MNLSALFTSPSVMLPQQGYDPSRATFDSFLRNIFDSYLQEVRSISDPEFPGISSEVKNSFQILENLATTVVSAVRHYLEGYPAPAYSEIEHALESVDLDNLFSRLSRSRHAGGFVGESAFFLECLLHPPLYRLRADRTISVDKRPSRKDIFHVPFQNRHRVGNQRYSIAGLPCLYLGSSIWICWEELNRPELNQTWGQTGRSPVFQLRSGNSDSRVAHSSPILA